MARQTVKLEGFRELDNALAELPKATGRAVLRRVLKKAAEPVREVWEATAPRDSGFLAGSIAVGPSSALTKRQRRDAKKEGPAFAEIHIGTKDPAGQQQEFGNARHPAQPSGRPAWDATQDQVLDGIKTDLADEIENAADRLARKAVRLAAKG